MYLIREHYVNEPMTNINQYHLSAVHRFLITFPRNPNALPNLDTIEGVSSEIMLRYSGDRPIRS